MFYLDNPLIYESVSQRLSQLAACGIRLFPLVALDDVITALCFDPSLGDSKVDVVPSDADILAAISFSYDSMVSVFRIYEHETILPLSETVWYLDQECIYQEEDYIKIIVSMMTLAGNALPIKNISVKFEKETHIAHVNFELDERKYEWDYKLYYDWLDCEILTNLAILLRERNASIHFAMHRESETDGFIVCLTKEQIEKINQTMDLRFEYL